MGKNDIDVVGILKWATETKNQLQERQPQPRNRGYRDYRRNPMDKLFNDFLEDQLRNKFKEMDDKINKKEEKKEEKTWWDKQSFFQKFAILTATVPIGMMSLVILCLSFAKIVKLFF